MSSLPASEDKLGARADPGGIEPKVEEPPYSIAAEDTVLEIQYVFSFLLSPFNVGCYYELHKHESEQRATSRAPADQQPSYLNQIIGSFSIEERIEQLYKGLHSIDILFDRGQNPVVHMAEEKVPVPARLPLYHRFPHISVGYSLGTWALRKKRLAVRTDDGGPAEPKSEEIPEFGLVDLEIRIFAFESGAGLLTIVLNKQEVNGQIRVGKNLENLETAFRLADFCDYNVPANEGYVDLPFITIPLAERYGYKTDLAPTLQDIYILELSRFIGVLNRIPQKVEKEEKVKANTTDESLALAVTRADRGVVRFKELHSIDDIMLCKLYQYNQKKWPYQQRPFTIATIISGAQGLDRAVSELQTAERGEGEGLQPYATLLRKSISGVLREELASISRPINLRDVGVSADALCFQGNSGAVTLLKVNVSPESVEQATGVVQRVFGSVRLMWHAMTVMNTYMGMKLTELSDQIYQIKSSADKDSDNQVLHRERDMLDNWRSSFYAFLMADDPIINAVHFAPYSQMFHKASDGYNYYAVKNELWRKIEALNMLQNEVDYEIRRKVTVKQARSFGGGLRIASILILLCAIAYLVSPLIVSATGFTPLWTYNRNQFFVALLIIIFTVNVVYQGIRRSRKRGDR